MNDPAVLVVDTSVAAKWYLPEPGSPAAVDLLEGGYALLAPDLIVPELGNVLWKKVQWGEITAADAHRVAGAWVEACPVRILASAPYLSAALEIALRHGRTVYDALYLALAVERAGRYVSADDRLVHALAGTELASVVWQLGS